MILRVVGYEEMDFFHARMHPDKRPCRANVYLHEVSAPCLLAPGHEGKHEAVFLVRYQEDGA